MAGVAGGHTRPGRLLCGDVLRIRAPLLELRPPQLALQLAQVVIRTGLASGLRPPPGLLLRSFVPLGTRRPLAPEGLMNPDSLRPVRLVLCLPASGRPSSLRLRVCCSRRRALRVWHRVSAH